MSPLAQTLSALNGPGGVKGRTSGEKRLVSVRDIRNMSHCLSSRCLPPKGYEAYLHQSQSCTLNNLVQRAPRSAYLAYCHFRESANGTGPLPIHCNALYCGSRPAAHIKPIISHIWPTFARIRPAQLRRRVVSWDSSVPDMSFVSVIRITRVARRASLSPSPT